MELRWGTKKTNGTFPKSGVADGDQLDIQLFGTSIVGDKR